MSEDTLTPTAGSVVARQLGLSFRIRRDPFTLGLPNLAGLALRDNPKRAHLVVSPVLAKHIPARPAAVQDAATKLGLQAQDALNGTSAPTGGAGHDAVITTVIGFCETATGLGHGVADTFANAYYVHTTRRPDSTRQTLAGFEEEHSHATSHHLQPATALPEGPMVLVDDELTTGTTALNLMAALHARQPRSQYILAALLDLRPAQNRLHFTARAAALGLNVEVVALLDADLSLPSDVLARAEPLQARLRQHTDPAPNAVHSGLSTLTSVWPRNLPRGGRHGFATSDRAHFDGAVAALAQRSVHPALSGGPVLMVGIEELMYLPIRLADALHSAGADVWVQSTTRSPVLILDDPGYAIRRRLAFASPEEPARTAYLYNISHYSDIVVISEDPAAACQPLLQALQPWATHNVHLLTP